MTYPETPCFLIELVGEQQEVGVMWDGQCGSTNLHCTRRRVGDITAVGELAMPDSLAPDWSDATCDHCGSRVGDAELRRFASLRRVWSTDDGTTNHPGATYLAKHDHACFNWDNCDGWHLHVVLPNGHPWDVDGRASNCDRRDDRTHRCWVRDGIPPNVTAGKGGNTCSAGAGSILAGDYHGFLRSGVLTAG